MIISDTMVDGMDAEWVALILEAKQLGLSKESVREFLHRNEVKEASIKNR